MLLYLQELCGRLLGGELKIPSAATWWCGEARCREHVLANLQQMVIKSAFASSRFDPFFPDRLAIAQREELAMTIRSRPQDYVGQAQVNLSTAPVLLDDRPQPRHLVMRADATA